MRLTSVTADNVLSMEHTLLEPDDTLTVIVGPNGVGKSNIVRVVTLAGLALEWLDERTSRLPGPEMTQPARSAMAAYAAARCRSSLPLATLRVEIGLHLGAEDVEDLVIFLRAAIVSTLMAGGDARLGQSLSAWAEKSVTPASVADLARGMLVLEHVGSPDAPWEASWEFQFAGQHCRWGLSDPGGGQLFVLDTSEDDRPARENSYVQLREAILGRPDSFGPGQLPEMPEFGLNLLLGNDGIPSEAPMVKANGGYLDPALGPHRAFAEMADVALWIQQPNRVYSLAWLLRRVFQRGLVFVGEQLRGIGTTATSLRPAGRYSVAELSSRAPGFEPYALPLRLARLKNGNLQERGRFGTVQELFSRLALGRGMELSFQLSQVGGEANDVKVDVTVLVTEHDSVSGADWELPVQMCGAGTWEALVLAEALTSPDRVVIMDEPALNLHPGWQQHLLGLLKERMGQSILITHSPYLLPIEDEDDIYRIVRVSRHEGTTRVSRASRPVTDPRAVIRDYSMSADARALLFASGAVLVEGETELGALPLWFAKSSTAKELGDPRSRHLAFFAVGSEDHFKAPLTLLAALGIPWVIVSDGGPLRIDMGRKHIFRQVAAAKAAPPGLQHFISSALDHPLVADKLTFAEVSLEAGRYGIFTLAPGWDRTKTDGISAESFEAFVEATSGLTGQLTAARRWSAIAKSGSAGGSRKRTHALTRSTDFTRTCSRRSSLQEGSPMTGDVKRTRPVEHPVPTDATVKALYATALRCGRPACMQLLYRISETGERVLNSEVAHMHARREGGPRWNPAMSADENRDYDNLILLCKQDASEIDATPQHFPVDLLREWKRAQVETQRQAAMSQPPLSDTEVAEVTRQSFGLDDAVAAIAGIIPFSPRLRTRNEALDRAVRQSLARRSTRLPVPADRLDAVLLWMAGQADPVVQVPEGTFRALVAPMGSGKSEQAARWWDDGLAAAQADPEIEIPVWFSARQIVTTGLEDAVTASIGHDPVKACRVVIDGLDDVSPREADQLLHQARQLVMTWPRAQVLATSRPGLQARAEESIRVDPWPAQRGLELVRTIAGNVGWDLWTAEAMDLLTSPLTALAVAGRLLEGRDIRVSRLTLLRDLSATILQQRRPEQATPRLWEQLARLAGRILSEPAPVRADSFGNEAQIWELTDTGLVVNDDGILNFALPVFEQHFGAQAITGDIVRLETAAGSDMFPRWRYAVAFAVSTNEPGQAEDYTRRLATANPGAASWILDEIAAGEKANAAPDRAGVASLPSLRLADSEERTDPAILRGQSLRDALQALLAGFGSCRTDLTRHFQGQLVQWGAQLFGDEWIGLYEARGTLPPPDVIVVPGDSWENRLPDGWSRQTLFQYPPGHLGRWTWARNWLKRGLADVIRRRRLPVPLNSPLATERRWVIAQRIMQIARKPYSTDIPLSDLRAALDVMMEQVNRTVRSTWHGGGESIDSDDVRWMHAQLQAVTGDMLTRPWPLPDLPLPWGVWRWQGYSPELSHAVSVGVLRDAVTGYRDLVDENFPCFGGTLSLNSVLPVRVEGLVDIPEDDVDGMRSGLLYELKPDPTANRESVPIVHLGLSKSSPGRHTHVFTSAVDRKRAPFYRPIAQNALLPTGTVRPATNLAYQWLAADLHALGWLDTALQFDN